MIGLGKKIQTIFRCQGGFYWIKVANSWATGAYFGKTDRKSGLRDNIFHDAQRTVAYAKIYGYAYNLPYLRYFLVFFFLVLVVVAKRELFDTPTMVPRTTFGGGARVFEIDVVFVRTAFTLSHLMVSGLIISDGPAKASNLHG